MMALANFIVLILNLLVQVEISVFQLLMHVMAHLSSVMLDGVLTVLMALMKAKLVVVALMEGAVELSVPVAVDWGVGTSWYETKG